METVSFRVRCYYNQYWDIKNYYSDGEFLFHEDSHHTISYEQTDL